ncbi:HAMP domain-containing histidine kinase [Thalassomonas viridans]|uniref:histidine kinase n=1 Tax=Thalassomonas viridans TaxID=137584 RepID=A0AAE9Z0F8_9GAMM|nr:HAMP domain-containing sensor histidine kinase [Thalassomonas viridans]WDE03759.1 HAMP domain-containing histidine kinase [Thalassomonas viridans]
MFKSKTLEAYILRWLGFFAALFVLLLYLLLQLLDWSPWHQVLATGLTALGLMLAILHFRKRLMATFDRALLHIEAVRMEDYNQYAKSDFPGGNVGAFHRELTQLSEYLSGQKLRYDQHAFLIYQLIDQLDTPILVFNEKNKLTYANGAFTLLYDQPWQMYRLASPKLLGLNKSKQGWQLEDKKQQWQISHSEFIDGGEAHQLLVFTNITSALRASQLNAWQQIIRVVGHEIRNSLTPVSSLAESLAGRANDGRDQKALALISERCHHLQDFISRYASLSQKLNLDIRQIAVGELTERLSGLFPEQQLEFNTGLQWLSADQTFFEQVLINLVKNAIEAGADHIALSFKEVKGRHQLQLTDNGHGFANLDNLFVPLFTTKQNGQGIGLTFCRNIIEQHRGSIKLENNADRGVRVTIELPQTNLS